MVNISLSINWDENALRIIPITKFKFPNQQIHNKLDHGYEVLSFFPTWGEFLKRSEGIFEGYQNYMTYLLCKLDSKGDNDDFNKEISLSKIIGVIAVQLIDYNSLNNKFEAVIPEIENYLYLSWIGLDKEYQSSNYFSLLFEFYFTLIRRYRNEFNLEIEGSAIIMRRMRPVLWSLFNHEIECPLTNKKEIIKDSPRFRFIFIPVEIIDSKIELKKDYVIMFFKQRKI